MKRREPAWRILSSEFNNINVVLKSSGVKEPNYVLTPLGAKINRVFIVGKAIAREDFGSDGHAFYRIKVTDPTGIFYLAIGEYQSAALGALKNIEIPSYVAVIGKIKTYQPDNGGLYLSIRPELIYPTTAGQRDRWLCSAARSLKARLEAVTEAQQMVEPTAERLMALGYPRLLAEGVKLALERYGKISLEPYQTILRDALQVMVDNGTASGSVHDAIPNAPGISPQGTETISVASALSGSAGNYVTADENAAVRKIVLDIVGSSPLSRKIGINWNELLFEVKKHGIEKMAAEVAVRELMDRGMIYEPVIGVLKKIQ